MFSLAAGCKMYVKGLETKPPVFYAALLIVTLLPLYLGSYHYRLHHPYGGGSPTHQPDKPPPPDFVQEWLDVQVVQPFNPSPIAAYCNRTEWRPNLTFKLASAHGDVGSIRGNILDFIFYAIEAGASIILPRIGERRDDLDHIFDRNWFLRALGEACPQMIIYEPTAEQPLDEALHGFFSPRSRRMDFNQGNTKKAYLEHLDTWLQSRENYRPDMANLVYVEPTLWEVDTRNLPLGFRRNFGQLLRAAPPARKLAAATIQRLKNRFHFKVDPKDTVPQDAFYCARLPTKADVERAEKMGLANANLSAQTDAHIEQALKHKLKVIYTDHGDLVDLEFFKSKAAAVRPPLNVTSKDELLAVEGRRELQRLTIEQQTLIDYEVLQRCSFFAGFVNSSFSYNVAIARNQWLEDEGRPMEPFFVQHKEEDVAFDDGISRLLGRDPGNEKEASRGMWP
jgi:hypothetical protein